MEESASKLGLSVAELISSEGCHSRGQFQIEPILFRDSATPSPGPPVIQQTLSQLKAIFQISKGL